jgi:hypothetical protein
MVGYTVPTNIREMVKSGGKPPPDHFKHTPFAMFETDCCLCRKHISKSRDADIKLMIQDQTRRASGFKPLIVWVCGECYSKLGDVFYKEKQGSGPERMKRRQKEIDSGLEFGFDSDTLEPVPPKDHPSSWFVSPEMKEAYLKIRDYVKSGLLPKTEEEQYIHEKQILDYKCYFTHNVVETNTLYFENTSRPLELTPLTTPIHPDDEFIQPYFYIHPLVEDIIIYLEDQARKNGEGILNQVTQDTCKAPLCEAIYNISKEEYRKRERQGTLKDHFCMECLSAEGLAGNARFSSAFCKANKHSMIIDVTRYLGAIPEDCKICKQEQSLSYGYKHFDQGTQVISTTQYDVIAFGGTPSDGTETIVLDIMQSGACDRFGVSVYLKNSEDFIPMDEYNTDFGECGLVDCKCFKGKFKAQIETLRQIKKYYKIESKSKW